MISRRALLGSLAATTLPGRGRAETLPPVRVLTRGPKFHWFGYYDKLEFDPTNRYVLGNEVDFQGRSPGPDDTITVGMVDLKAGDKWLPLGESRAWSWQQGCMLQWLPGSRTHVIWNDRQKDKYVSHVLDVRTKKKRTLPGPVYGISPDARFAVFPDFRRLHHLRPGYGYAGIPDPNMDVLAPTDAGCWRMDLKTGKLDLLFSFADVAKIPGKNPFPEGAKHWFNHLLFSPDGSRFIFLHRWKGPSDKGFKTRMITAKPDGTDLYVVDPHENTSHFIWRDNQHILAWAYHPSHKDKFYLYKDKTQEVEVVAPDLMPVNGHCTYLPGNRFILNDCYPDKNRVQTPYLYDTRTGKRHDIGHFPSPPEYTGEFRCDLHPRFSPDGHKVVIDAPHEGGRQLHLIDVSTIVG